MTTFIVTAGDARISRLVRLAAGTDITAVVVGPRDVADQVAHSGVDQVIWLNESCEGPAESLAPAIADLIVASAPRLVLASTRPADRTIAGAIAARLGAPAYTMVTRASATSDGCEIEHTAFGGIAQRTVHVPGCAVLVVEGGEVADGGSAPVHEHAGAAGGEMSIVETRPAERAQVDLGKAKRIVSVGRGLKSEHDIALVAALADALGAELACSRPLAEGLGWFTHDRYVGVTGQHVRPELYLAIGISGQLQHAVGAREAGVIVAINSDKDCPYFREADFCVLGDLYQLLPAITAAVGSER